MKMSSVCQVLSDISKSQIFTYMRKCRAVTVSEFSEFRLHCETEEIVFQLGALTTAVKEQANVNMDLSIIIIAI